MEKLDYLLEGFSGKSVCISDNLGRKVIGKLVGEIEKTFEQAPQVNRWGLEHPFEIGFDSSTNNIMMADWIPHTSEKVWYFTEDFVCGISSLDGEIEDHWLKQSGQKIIIEPPKPKIVL